MEKSTIGILGGMGPAATVELFSRIINETVAETDQEHLKMIIMNDPQIPDRSNFILENGPSPVPKLIENLKILSNAGADVAVIPCMTAHSFLKELRYNSPIPIVNGISLVDEYINENYPNINKVGLLATNGSIESGVFPGYLSKEVVAPSKIDQVEVMEIIYGENGIKSGNTSHRLSKRIKKITDRLVEEDNIEAVIAGCTELSLVMKESHIGIPVLDPITYLARKAVNIGNNYSEETTSNKNWS
ncbi:aspartate/glutamate racemase family protein [Salinicoccus roseus]|uniref:aspartate/glutamate racemase family protein n=1 Tax=Salinicoccus roseus TaxID=45670 RepID=UPI001EF580B2|nr:amino acid racemase [Salinicoccus roseus]MCG7333030.1 amino acid racemase [Salinicoccus roseus]